MEERLIEGGHYYVSYGATKWSLVGWEIVNGLWRPGDSTLIFVDDVHERSSVSALELSHPVVDFSPSADYMVYESSVKREAFEALEMLKALKKGKRARRSQVDGRWHCSGAQLTDWRGQPLCLLLDLGLTSRKSRLGFSQLVNVLPEFYAGEQENLRRLAAKIFPDVSLEVVLYDIDGRHWNV